MIDLTLIIDLQGAYAQNHIYSQSDVAAVIKHAKDRGIRVIPEFDSPVSSSNPTMCKSFQPLLILCNVSQSRANIAIATQLTRASS